MLLTYSDFLTEVLDRNSEDGCSHITEHLRDLAVTVKGNFDGGRTFSVVTQPYPPSEKAQQKYVRN